MFFLNTVYKVVQLQWVWEMNLTTWVQLKC